MADLSNPQSWNQYAYVMNNPTNWIDPNGLWTWTWGDCTFNTVAVLVNGQLQGFDTKISYCGAGGQAAGNHQTGGGSGAGNGGGGGASAHWDDNRPSCVGQFVRDSWSSVRGWAQRHAQGFSSDAAGLASPTDPEAWGPQAGAGIVAAAAQSVSSSGAIGQAVLEGGVVARVTLNAIAASLSAAAALASNAAGWLDAAKTAAIASSDTKLIAAFGTSTAELGAGFGAVAVSAYAAGSTSWAAYKGGCTGDKLW